MIYFDLDETLVDLPKGYQEATGNPFTQEYYDSVTKLEFWQCTFYDGFWADLPRTAEFDRLLGLAFGYTDQVGILSAAISNRTAWCISEKYQWVRKNIPTIDPLNIHIVPHARDKAAYAKRSTQHLPCLIDDKFQNCLEFSTAGGVGIHFRAGTEAPFRILQALLDSYYV